MMLAGVWWLILVRYTQTVVLGGMEELDHFPSVDSLAHG